MAKKRYSQLTESLEKQEIKELIAEANLQEYYPGMDYPVPQMSTAGSYANSAYIHPKKLASVGGIHYDPYHQVGAEAYFHATTGEELRGVVHTKNGNAITLKDYNSGKAHKFTQWNPHDRIHLKNDGKIYQGENEISKGDLQRHVELKNKLNQFKDINEEKEEEKKCPDCHSKMCPTCKDCPKCSDYHAMNCGWSIKKHVPKAVYDEETQLTEAKKYDYHPKGTKVFANGRPGVVHDVSPSRDAGVIWAPKHEHYNYIIQHKDGSRSTEYNAHRIKRLKEEIELTEGAKEAHDKEMKSRGWREVTNPKPGQKETTYHHVPFGRGGQIKKESGKVVVNHAKNTWVHHGVSGAKAYGMMGEELEKLDEGILKKIFGKKTECANCKGSGFGPHRPSSGLFLQFLRPKCKNCKGKGYTKE